VTNERRVLRLTVAATAGLALGIAQVASGQRGSTVPAQPAAPAPVVVGPVNGTSLYLRPGVVDTSGGRVGLSQFAGAASGGRQFVVQLDGPMTPARRTQMTGAGVWIGAYLPMYAYIVRLDHADPNAVAGLGFIRWFSEYQDGWKLDPDVGRVPASTPDLAGVAARGRQAVVVTLFSTLTRQEEAAAQRAVWALPGVVSYWEQRIGESMTMSLEVRPQDVGALVRLPGVQYVEAAPDAAARNITTRWIVQSNQPGVTPLYAAGLHGEGQIVGILDGKIDQNHCSFKDTAPIGPSHRKIVAYNTTAGADLHGTHVGGIAVGDAGVDTAETRGVAYLGKLAYNVIPAFNETAVLTSLNLHHSQGARVHTNSWGNDGTTAYDSMCRGFDSFNWTNEDDLVCLAVTNQSLLKNPENAKNLLAVGNSNDAPNQSGICTGGAGPTSDGRRKPEVFAPGCNVQSAQASSTCGTTGLTGTSMASPATAGVGMLIRQYFTDGYYPSGVATPSNGFTPSGALLKAALINSAVDMAPAGYPSNAEGWGRILADNALYFFGETRKLLVSDVRNSAGLSTGQEATVPLNVLGSGQQLRITLVWMEPPATAGASFAAINDLDLEVEGPGGLYKGNVFSGGVSVPGGTKDDRNNVEQVHLTNPQVGAWTVRIRGANVAQATQGYALLVSGDIQAGEPPSLVISLPAGYPSLIAPNVPTDISVQVVPGSQAVVPGSEKMYYRFAPGAYTPVTMTNLGGTLYRATLPAASCTAQPEFYFRADGDGGAAAALPMNAPTNVLSATVGTLQTQTVFQESFEGSLPAGWSATGLWNLTNLCGTSGACDGSKWAYYGNTSTCTFATGSTTNSGALTAAPIALPSVPPGGVIKLSYCSALETENLSTYDKAEVFVNGTAVDRAAESATWETREVDLTSYAGQTVTIKWNFDTVDGINNNFRGWQVDNVKIKVTSLVCQSSCYADCNGDGLLGLADFGCFQTKFALGDPYADCNGDGLLGLADFGCFQTKFALGCP
jgi:hypothetical protein